MSSIYDFTATRLDGEPLALNQYRGKVLLIVNTASQCGFTPQYEGLENLHQQLHDKGLEIIGFPCNQFGKQEPGNSQDIQQFCQRNYGVSFTIAEKIDVNGANTAALYSYLKSAKPGILGTQRIKWNFTKFLVDTNGTVVKRYAPSVKPKDIEDDIRKLLN